MPVNELPCAWYVRLVRRFVAAVVLLGLCGALGCGGAEVPTSSAGPTNVKVNKRMPK